MKVVLLKNVDKIGKALDVKEIKDGYARNFLIPKKLARVADEATMKWLKTQLEMKQQQASEDLEKATQTASALDGLEIEMTVKVGDKGQFFEKLSPTKIAARLKEMGYEVKKNQIELKDEITEVGEYDAKIKLEHNLEANIKLIVTEDEN